MMPRAGWSVVALAACGSGSGSRADATEAVGDGSLVDGDPTAIDAPDGAAVSCTAQDRRLTVATGESGEPSVAARGSEFGVAWHDYRSAAGIYFARLDASGARIGNEVVVTNGGIDPFLTADGTGYGLTWIDFRDGRSEVYFARLDAAGVKQGNDVRVTNAVGAKSFPRIAWSGSESGIAWIDTRSNTLEYYFARINAVGVKQAAEILLTDGTGTNISGTHPFVVWNDSEWAIVWSDGRTSGQELWAARVSAAGAEIATEKRITNTTAQAQFPRAVWTGSQYGVVWQEDSTGTGTTDLWFARFDTLFNQQGSQPTRITNDATSSHRAAMAWMGGAFQIFYTDERIGRAEIWRATVDTSSNEVGAEAKLTGGTAQAYGSSFAWNGTNGMVAWMDSRDGNLEIYARGVCSP